MATTHKARGYLVTTDDVPDSHVPGWQVVAVFKEHYSALYPEMDIRGYGVDAEAAIADLFERQDAHFFRENPPAGDAELERRLVPNSERIRRMWANGGRAE